MRYHVVFIASLALVACGDSHTTDDNASVILQATYQADVESYETIAALTKANDTPSQIFTNIETEYTKQGLNTRIKNRTDAHTEHAVANIGEFLDAQIKGAIEIGKAPGSSAEDIALAGQVIKKSLLVYFHAAMYGVLHEGKDTSADEASAIFGASSDGTTGKGLAKAAIARDHGFSKTLTFQIIKLLKEIKKDKTGLVALDAALAHVMLLCVLEEVEGALEATSSADITEKLVEARVYWESVAPYIRRHNLDADGLYALLYPNVTLDRTRKNFFLVGKEHLPTADVAAMKAAIEYMLEHAF